MLVDTNVVLEVLAAREPFVMAAQRIFDLATKGEFEGFLCVTTLTNIQYLLRKYVDVTAALRHIRGLLSIFDVAPVDRLVLAAAADNAIKDFEDAVLLEAAKRVKAKLIVTRNVKDFVKSEIPALEPAEFLALFQV